MNWDSTTRKPNKDPGSAENLELMSLTIACHLDLRRIGERAFLSQLERGDAVGISRVQPDFAQPRAPWGRALEDAFLSRKPLWLKPSGGGAVLLDPADCPISIRVGEDVVSAPHRLSAEAVRAGVAVELADRLVLVLHYLP